jgi:hypothetical protein
VPVRLSITLPSLYPEALAATLENIAATTRGSYEVIVVSPFEPPRIGNVDCIREAEPRGCAAAHALAAKAAVGEYLVAFADDHEFVDGWDDVAISEHVRRRASFGNDCARIGLPTLPFSLGLRGSHSGHVGTNFGIYCPYFPMMLAEDVRRVGWIGADYRAGFGDSDLAMRVWRSGGRCEWTAAGLLRPTPADKRKETASDRRPAAAYTQADLELFVGRWWPHYGCEWPIGIGIDTFNTDLRPEENTALIVNNSIFCNDAATFAERVVRMTW